MEIKKAACLRTPGYTPAGLGHRGNVRVLLRPRRRAVAHRRLQGGRAKAVSGSVKLWVATSLVHELRR